MLCLCVCAGPAAAQYFDLLHEQLDSAEVAAHMVAHDLMSDILHQISQHVSRLVATEYGCSLDVTPATARLQAGPTASSPAR